MAKNILYIPGLGGERTVRAQQVWVKVLNIFKRRKIHFFDPHWEVSGGETDKVRYTRLLDEFEEAGNPTEVWGASAGGSLAIRLGVEKGLEVKLVCAKAQGAAKIGKDYEDRAPHFTESVHASQAAIASANYNPVKFTAYVPRGKKYDGVLDVEDMIPKNCNIVYLPGLLKHTSLIIYSLFRHLSQA